MSTGKREKVCQWKNGLSPGERCRKYRKSIASFLALILQTRSDVNKISFTGSTGVGKTIAKGAADTMKRVTLELGGKSPNIILDDADFADAIPKAIFAAYLNSGQACAAATRLLVPAKRLDEVNAIAKATIEQAVKVGDPKDKKRQHRPDGEPQTMGNHSRLYPQRHRAGATLLTGGLGKPEGLKQAIL